MRHRPFTDADYPAYASLWSTVFPDEPYTAEELRSFDDAVRDPKYGLWQIVAQAPGVPGVVGYAFASSSIDAYSPQNVYGRILVAPGFRHRGIGSRLYEALVAELGHRGVRLLRWSTRDDQADGLRFLQRHGFQERHRYWELEIDLSGFQTEQFRDVISRLEEHGIAFRSLAEEGIRNPAVRRRVWELVREAGEDEPRDDPYTPEDLPGFERSTLKDAEEVAEGWFVARVGDSYVGVAGVYRMDAVPGLLRQSFTGVRRAYRGRGFATALKARVLDYAQQHGYRAVRTTNDATNTAMLRVNERLGFRRRSGWGLYERHLGP